MSNLYFWLVSCLESSPSDDELTFTSIYDTYLDDVTDLQGKACSKYMLSRAIHVLFPAVSIKRKKVHGIRDTYYGNLRWKSPTFTPINAFNFRCPESFRILRQMGSYGFTLQKALGVVVNDSYPLTLEVTVRDTCWYLNFCMQALNKAKFGLESKFEWTQECLDKIAMVVESFKLCIGRQTGQASRQVVEEHIMFCSRDSTNSSTTVRYRNRACERLIPPTSYGDVCRVCLKGVKAAGETQEEPGSGDEESDQSDS